LINPLVQREFFGILRSPKALAALVALSAIFSLIVLMRWPAEATVDLSGAQSVQVFRLFGYGLLAGVVFLVPAFPAVSIVQERNKGTLALLLNSPLKPWAIYIGKLSGVLLFSFLILIVSLPAAAACYAMGGVELVGQLGLLYAVLLLLVVQYSTLGLLVSSYVQSADAAVRVTYAATFSLSFLTLVPHAFYQGQAGLLGWTAGWLRHLSPLPVVMQIMGHGDLGSRGLMRTSWDADEFVGLTIASSLLFAVITLTRLSHRIFDRSRAKGVMTEDRSAAVRSFRRLVFVVDPQRRKAGIPWYLNPVMVKEFRSRRFGRSQWLLRLIALCAVTSLGLTFAAATSVVDWGVDTIGSLMVVLQIVLVVLIAPSLSAGMISGERDGGTWDLMRMTPLSTFKILRGKLLSVASTLVLVLMATLPGYLVMIYIQPAMWLQVYQVLVSLLLTALYASMVSAATGCWFRRTAVATTSAYVVLLLLFAGPLLVWLGRNAPFGYETVRTALLVNPMGAALSVIDTPGFDYELLPASWTVAIVVSVLAFLLLCIQTFRLTRPV
jgi:ABC-type transport system involved in multi-copper enzyme maturation permease subunit